MARLGGLQVQAFRGSASLESSSTPLLPDLSLNKPVAMAEHFLVLPTCSPANTRAVSSTFLDVQEWQMLKRATKNKR